MTTMTTTTAAAKLTKPQQAALDRITTIGFANMPVCEHGTTKTGINTAVLHSLHKLGLIDFDNIYTRGRVRNPRLTTASAVVAPAVVAPTSDTKTQQRGICPACFAQQALTKGAALVNHGYTRPQHWHSNVGTCTGAGRMHFGTEKGRDYTREIATQLREHTQTQFERAYRVEQGTEPVMQRERVKGTRVYSLVAVDAPTQSQREQYAATLRQQAAAMRTQASELDALVAAWKPAQPVVVNVEAKTTLLHMRDTGRRFGGKLCASSAMGAMKGYTTSDPAHVTCDKCKARMARRAEAAAAATK